MVDLDELERLRTVVDVHGGRDNALNYTSALRKQMPDVIAELRAARETIAEKGAEISLLKSQLNAKELIALRCGEFINALGHRGDLTEAAGNALAAEIAVLRVSPGVSTVAKERQRQIEKEGWTPDHDDEHRLSELTRAGMVYANLAARQACNPDAMIPMEPINWPWKFSWWEPDRNPIRNLVKAAALIVAEIDRLQRATLPAPDTRCPECGGMGCALCVEGWVKP